MLVIQGGDTVIKIGTIGYNHSHDANFVIDRPNGPGTYLFLLIKTEAQFIICDQTYDVSKGSYILFRPTTSCIYKAVTDCYCDDWFYLEMDDSDVEALEKMGIILDVPLHLGDIDELSRIIFNLTYEHYSLDEFNTELEQRYLDILMMKIARILRSSVKQLNSTFIDKKTSLINLRTTIYNEPDNVSDVSEMAKRVGMSRSGLQHNYKKMFGVSIMQDVIASRIERAKRRLIGTNASISEISRACGYNCEYSFMRQFKERTGYTPTEFRNVAAAGEGDFAKEKNDEN